MLIQAKRKAPARANRSNRTEGFLHKTLHAAPPRETESATRRSTEDEIEAEIATRREDEEDDDDGGGGDNNDDDDDDDDN